MVVRLARAMLWAATAFVGPSAMALTASDDSDIKAAYCLGVSEAHDYFLNYVFSLPGTPPPNEFGKESIAQGKAMIAQYRTYLANRGLIGPNRIPLHISHAYKSGTGDVNLCHREQMGLPPALPRVLNWGARQ